MTEWSRLRAPQKVGRLRAIHMVIRLARHFWDHESQQPQEFYEKMIPWADAAVDVIEKLDSED